MGLSYLLTLVSAIGGVEDLDPRLKMLHPAGILLFFAWFLWWDRFGLPAIYHRFRPRCGLWKAAQGRKAAMNRRTPKPPYLSPETQPLYSVVYQ